ncbi:glutathione binding-like protein [Tianweitania populi]|uniref:Glutathione S-transferase n=1 Tax=Tianweitania populi TaxID=1607949 RepID=A0A8J3E0K7_9HYPH|nr:glutathione binding-like protein [Tianweitania populi]GHD23601.1 glutathione S-transferase [Tianweitania populi]
MKLYHAPGACSLASLIAAAEYDIKLELAQVDIKASPHLLADGSDFQVVSPKGYVPVLELDDGQYLTEGVAILQYLADQRSTSISKPVEKPLTKYRILEWLTFVATELHKSFSPWLFHPEYGEQAAAVARARISDRFDFLEKHLNQSEYLVESTFSVADAYCFSIVRWAPGKGINLTSWPALVAYLERIASRPKVAHAVQRHG